jgi:hypothetical protein
MPSSIWIQFVNQTGRSLLIFHSHKPICHVTVWLQRGFALMTRFIAYFDTARDYILQFTITHTLMSTDTSSLPLLSIGFQRRTFPFLRFPNGLWPQLPAYKNKSSQWLNPSSSLTLLNSSSVQFSSVNCCWLSPAVVVFGPRWDPWPYFCSSQLLRVLK